MPQSDSSSSTRTAAALEALSKKISAEASASQQAISEVSADVKALDVDIKETQNLVETLDGRVDALEKKGAGGRAAASGDGSGSTLVRVNAEDVKVGRDVSQVTLVNVVAEGDDFPVDDNTTIDISIPLTFDDSLARGTVGSLVSRWNASGVAVPEDEDDIVEAPAGPDGGPGLVTSVWDLPVTAAARVRGDSKVNLRRLPAIADQISNSSRENGTAADPYRFITKASLSKNSAYLPEVLRGGTYSLGGNGFNNMYLKGAVGRDNIEESEYSGLTRAAGGAAPNSSIIHMTGAMSRKLHTAGGHTSNASQPFLPNIVRLMPQDMDSKKFEASADGDVSDYFPANYAPLDVMLQRQVTHVVDGKVEVDVVDTACVTQAEYDAMRAYVQAAVAAYGKINGGIAPATPAQVDKWFDANVATGPPIYHGFLDAFTPQMVLNPLPYEDVLNEDGALIKGGASKFVDALPATSRFPGPAGHANFPFVKEKNDPSLLVLQEMNARAAQELGDIILQDGNVLSAAQVPDLETGQLLSATPFFTANVAPVTSVQTQAANAATTPSFDVTVGKFLCKPDAPIEIPKISSLVDVTAYDMTNIDTAMAAVEAKAAECNVDPKTFLVETRAELNKLKDPNITLLDSAAQTTLDVDLNILLQATGALEAAISGSSPFSATLDNLAVTGNTPPAALPTFATAIDTGLGAGTPLTILKGSANANTPAARAIKVIECAGELATLFENVLLADAVNLHDSTTTEDFYNFEPDNYMGMTHAAGARTDLYTMLLKRQRVIQEDAYFTENPTSGDTRIGITQRAKELYDQYVFSASTPPPSTSAPGLVFAEMFVERHEFVIKPVPNARIRVLNAPSEYATGNQALGLVLTAFFENSAFTVNANGVVTGKSTPLRPITASGSNNEYQVTDLSKSADHTLVFVASGFNTSTASLAFLDAQGQPVEIIGNQINYFWGSQWFLYAYGLKYVQDKATATNGSSPLQNPRPAAPGDALFGGPMYFRLSSPGQLVELDPAVLAAHTQDLVANDEAYKMQAIQIPGQDTVLNVIPRLTPDAVNTPSGEPQEVFTTQAAFAMMPALGAMPKPAKMNVPSRNGGEMFSGTVYTYVMVPEFLFQLPFHTYAFSSMDNLTLPCDTSALLTMRSVVGQLAQNDGGPGSMEAAFVLDADIRVLGGKAQVLRQRITQTAMTEGTMETSTGRFILGNIPGNLMAFETLAVEGSFGHSGANSYGSPTAGGVFTNRYGNLTKPDPRIMTPEEVKQWMELAARATERGSERPAASLSVSLVKHDKVQELQFQLRVSTNSMGRDVPGVLGGEPILGAPGLLSTAQFQVVSLQRGVMDPPQKALKMQAVDYEDTCDETDHREKTMKAEAKKLGYTLESIPSIDLLFMEKDDSKCKVGACGMKRSGYSGANVANGKALFRARRDAFRRS